MQKAVYLLDPAAFIRDVLGYQVEPCHQAILHHLTVAQKTLDLAPRGFGKSTIGDIGYCLWRIILDRNIRILVVSNTGAQADAFVREIKHHLTNNKTLHRLYGTFQSEKWTESEIIVSGRSTAAKEGTITSLGASGAIISKHYDLIIGDDLVDFENARTELQRRKLSEWYRTALLPCLEPHGEIHILGTRYHPLELYQDIIDCGQYSTQTQAAIQPDGTSLWQDKFSLERLAMIKAELGSVIFGLQYQNSIDLAMQGKIFRYEWMQFYTSETIPAPENMKIYQGVDLAISTTEAADYFVLCTLGITKNKDVFIVDIYRDRISFNQQKEIIRKKNEQWQPISIGIETNAYQRALSQELIRTTGLPIREIQTVKDKVTRAQKRSALFENGKVFMKKDMTVMIDELCLFPDASHDDCFDAFDIAVTVSDRLNPDRFKVDARRMGNNSSGSN